ARAGDGGRRGVVDVYGDAVAAGEVIGVAAVNGLNEVRTGGESVGRQGGSAVGEGDQAAQVHAAVTELDGAGGGVGGGGSEGDTKGDRGARPAQQGIGAGSEVELIGGGLVGKDDGHRTGRRQLIGGAGGIDLEIGEADHAV